MSPDLLITQSISNLHTDTADMSGFIRLQKLSKSFIKRLQPADWQTKLFKVVLKKDDVPNVKSQSSCMHQFTFLLVASEMDQHLMLKHFMSTSHQISMYRVKPPLA